MSCLALLTGDDGFEKKAVNAIRTVAPLMSRYASGFGRWLSALDFHLGPPLEVALVWPGASKAGRQALLTELFRRYLPNLAVAGGAAESETQGIPLLEGKRAVEGKATAYVCERYACQAPTTDPATFSAQLAARSSAP